MKTLIISLALTAGMMLVAPAQSHAQQSGEKEGTECAAQGKYEKTSFEVDGKCSMCKDRIEKAAQKVKGVKKATWDQEAKQLSMTYHEDKAKVMDVHRRIAAAGHDTGKVQAKDEDYQALPMCCKYREE